jgi:hypothetical protein
VSIDGRRAAAIRSAIQDGLDGYTLPGLTHLLVTLSKSCDPLNVVSPAQSITCVDGGFVVLVSGNSNGGATAQSSGGRVQALWTYNFRLRWSVDVSSCSLEKLDVDLQAIYDAVIDRMEAILQTFAASNYMLRSQSFAPPSMQGGFLVYEVSYAIDEFWSR